MIAAKRIYAAIFDRLETAGVGVTGSSFTPAQTALTAKRYPESPDRAITVTVYSRDDNGNPKLPDERVYFQVRCRAAAGNVLDVEDMAEAVKRALEGDHAEWLDFTAHTCRRQSYAPIGVDGRGRDETTSNFMVILSNA